jgi:mitochondrial import inner membrane translocase subunit TIM17
MSPRTGDTTREPCPDRILADVGFSYGMGALGGGAFHFAKGLYNSPNGYRLAGGATAVHMNAARVGGSFAVWGGLYSLVDCGLVYAHKREDPWNSIAAGATTSAVLSLRRGFLVSGRSALIGGVLLALLEGTGIMMNRYAANLPPPEAEGLPQFPGPDTTHPPAPGFLGVPPAPPTDVQVRPVPESGPTGWFGGLLGKKKKDDQVAGGHDRKPEMLELDLPSTAIPSFDYK